MLKRLLSTLAIVPLIFSPSAIAGEFDDLPQSTQIYIEAQRLVSLQKYNDAISLFTKAHEMTEEPLLKRLAATGILHSHLSAGFYYTRPKEVIHHLGEALKLKPELSNAWQFKGLAHCELKQYQDCDVSLSMAIKYSPPEVQHHHFWTRAMKRHETGKGNLAAKDFKAAASIAHQNGDLVSTKGYLMSAKAFGYNIQLR